MTEPAPTLYDVARVVLDRLDLDAQERGPSFYLPDELRETLRQALDREAPLDEPNPGPMSDKWPCRT